MSEQAVSISPEKLASDEERERWLAHSLDQLSEAIFLTDIEGVICYVNPAFTRLTGYDKEEAVGKTPRILKSDKHARILYDEMWQTIATGKPWKGRIINKRKDTSLFRTEVTISPILDSDGGVLFYTTILYDVAKSAGTEAQMLQAHKMEAIGELAAGIAHEINTPTQFIGDNIRFFQESFKKLAPVLTKCAEYTKAVQGEEDPTAILEELRALVSSFRLEYFVREIPNAVEQSLEGNRRVAEIVSAMKELTHPSMEEMMAIDINNAIKSTISVARNEWKYVAEIETLFDEKLPPVLCLPGQFNQAMLNLIVNAAHAIKEKHRRQDNENALGKIIVTTKRTGSWVEIRVEDTGTGIPKDIWTRIYDPFFTTKDVGKGTGQGLASVHFIVVEKHHGTIEFKTEDDVGTTFTIHLPIEGDSDD